MGMSQSYGTPNDPESIATIFDIIPFTHDAEGRITRFNEVSVDLMGE